jgi:hypothetical protein
MKVVRSQLPQKNDYYPSTADAMTPPRKLDEETERRRASCRVCGLHASKRCSSCRRVTYCSQAHQVADWRSRHSRECRAADPDAAVTASARLPAPAFDCLFPEFEIEDDAEDFDPEEEDDEKDEQAGNKEQQLEKLPDEMKDTAKEFDPEQYTSVVDKVFHAFRKRIELHPEQVLR